MRKALFGGTFDPVHVGHLIVAQVVLEHDVVEEVVFVPAHLPPHKQHLPPSAGHHRLEMLSLALADQPGFAISDVELQRGGVSYTIDTLEQLAASSPDSWALIIGADQMLEITGWKRYEELLASFPVLLTTRAGVPHNPEPLARCRQATVVQVPNIEISSSVIRARVAAGRRITHWVPPAVESYIARYGLYRTASASQRPSCTPGRHGRTSAE